MSSKKTKKVRFYILIAFQIEFLHEILSHFTSNFALIYLHKFINVSVKLSDLQTNVQKNNSMSRAWFSIKGYSLSTLSVQEYFMCHTLTETTITHEVVICSSKNMNDWEVQNLSLFVRLEEIFCQYGEIENQYFVGIGKLAAGNR